MPRIIAVAGLLLFVGCKDAPDCHRLVSERGDARLRSTKPRLAAATATRRRHSRTTAMRSGVRSADTTRRA